MCIRKSDALDEIKEPRNEKADSIYNNPDADPRGVWTSVSYVNPATKEQRPNLAYEIENPITGETVTHPTNAWKYEKSTYLKHVAENRLHWGKDGNNTYPRLKKFLSELDGGMVPVNLWKREDAGTTDEASKNLENLMDAKVFDFLSHIYSYTKSNENWYKTKRHHPRLLLRFRHYCPCGYATQRRRAGRRIYHERHEKHEK